MAVGYFRGVPGVPRGALSILVRVMQALAVAEQDVPTLPPFTFVRALTDWGIDPGPFVLCVWLAGLYVIGVRVLRRRGDRWPWGRSVAFLLAGVGGLAFATLSGLARYDTTLLSVHMVQHMVLNMWVPLFLALGAPVTLALRTLPRTPRRWLLALLHSRLAKVLSFPPLTFALFVTAPWILYFTDWYAATLRSDFLHATMHLHLVLVGALFFWPLVGPDPVPGRVPYVFRLLLLGLTLPFHAFLGVTIMRQERIIGHDWYAMLREGPMASWLPSMAEDQYLAGGILWGSGDLVGLTVFGVLFAQWVRHSMREAEREDRRLDLEERRQRAGG